MKQRSTEIIQRIIRSNGKKLSVGQLTEEYGISGRTLRNDIKEINAFLENIPMEGIEIDEDGKLIIKDSFNGSVAEQHLYAMDVYTYKMSREERQIYILIELIQNPHYTTMHHFAEKLLVSRVTVISDIEAIKEYLKPFQTELLLDSGKGMKLRCNYETSLDILIALYRSMAVNIKNDGYFQRMILNKMNIRFSFSEIFTPAQEYMKVNNLVFIEDIFYNIVLYIFTAFNFRQQDTLIGDRLISNKMELNGMDYVMLYVGYMLETPVTEQMVNRFREYIEKNSLHSFVKTVDEVELYKVIMYFVSKVDEELKLGLSNDGILIDSLLMHIKSMKDWGNYEVELPQNHDTLIDYDQLERLVEENANIIERFLCYDLSDNMKKSIVIHICVAIIRNRSYVPKLSVVIACPGSMATGKYLEAQIKNYFDFHIVGILTTNEVLYELEKKNEKVDFIISTVKIDTSKYKVLNVKPFLTMEDLNMIQREIFQKESKVNPVLKTKKRGILDDVKMLLEDDTVPDHVLEQIRGIINEYRPETGKVQNKIADLLEVELITINEDCLEWKQGMRSSAKLLEDRNIIEPKYIEKSIEHVEEYGDYIVVSTGVALAHADKDSGVNEDGLSLLVSKKGIEFSEENHKVHLIFCFASKGDHEYLELIKSIVSIGKRPEKLQKILSLETREEIYQEVIYD